jgi:hypothetical protein
MPTNFNNFSWEEFWKSFPEDVESDSEGLIFKDKNGQWITIFAIPNSREIISCAIDYNPFTGERLQ